MESIKTLQSLYTEFTISDRGGLVAEGKHNSDYYRA
jgi:hypothetical protein